MTVHNIDKKKEGNFYKILEEEDNVHIVLHLLHHHLIVSDQEGIFYSFI